MEVLDSTVHRLEDALHQCSSNQDIAHVFNDLRKDALLFSIISFMMLDVLGPSWSQYSEISKLQKKLCIALEDDSNLGLVHWMPTLVSDQSGLVSDSGMIYVHPSHRTSHACLLNQSYTNPHNLQHYGNHPGVAISYLALRTRRAMISWSMGIVKGV
jgi:hypothetical protein